MGPSSHVTPPPPPTRQLSDNVTNHMNLFIYMCCVCGVQWVRFFLLSLTDIIMGKSEWYALDML